MMPIVSENLNKKIKFVPHDVILRENVVLTDAEKDEYEELRYMIRHYNEDLFEE